MQGVTDHILRLLSQHWLLVSGTALLLWLVKNRYRNGLNKYPGPFLASLTDWWRLIDVYGRRSELTHRALHKKYGDVVRLGPNTLSFSDPSALKSIYGLNKGFVKVSLIHWQEASRPLLTMTSRTFILFNNPSQRVTA